MTRETTSPPRWISAAVVDASVVVKWFLADEELTQEARLVRDAWQRGVLDVIVPAHLRVEVPRAIQLAVRDGRVSPSAGSGLLEDFLGYVIPSVTTDDLIRDAFRLSSVYGIALYDSLYCALAERLSWPLLLADERLHNRLHTTLSYLTPLWDWPAYAPPNGFDRER